MTARGNYKSLRDDYQKMQNNKNIVLDRIKADYKALKSYDEYHVKTTLFLYANIYFIQQPNLNRKSKISNKVEEDQTNEDEEGDE